MKPGKIGDGKIFISTMEEAIRTRTGATGINAIQTNYNSYGGIK
jgi:nitrogen regulatory protein PII